MKTYLPKKISFCNYSADSKKKVGGSNLSSKEFQSQELQNLAKEQRI